jgi:hypothetical protein
MTAAFEEAWQNVKIGEPTDPMTTALRDKLARIIIAMAKAGERNPAALRDGALAFLRLAHPNKLD